MEGDSNYACAGGGGSIVLCMYIYLGVPKMQGRAPPMCQNVFGV